MSDKICRLDKSRVLAVEEGIGHLCFFCTDKGRNVWRLVGYDEFGELWICEHCWDLAEDAKSDDLNSDIAAP